LHKIKLLSAKSPPRNTGKTEKKSFFNGLMSGRFARGK